MAKAMTSLTVLGVLAFLVATPTRTVAPDPLRTQAADEGGALAIFGTCTVP